MEKTLFATISVEKENEKKEVKIYKTQGIKYGIEITEEKGGETKIQKADNLTSSEEKVDKLLNILVQSSQNFTLLDDFAYDFKDCEKVVN